MMAIAAPGECSPKKVGVQAAVKAICHPQSLRAGRRLSCHGLTCRQISQAAVPSMTSSTVQTGPKTQRGGVSGGAVSDRYQPVSASLDAAAPELHHECKTDKANQRQKLRAERFAPAVMPYVLEDTLLPLNAAPFSPRSGGQIGRWEDKPGARGLEAGRPLGDQRIERSGALVAIAGPSKLGAEANCTDCSKGIPSRLRICGRLRACARPRIRGERRSEGAWSMRSWGAAVTASAIRVESLGWP
jgi:hypothetical protein